MISKVWWLWFSHLFLAVSLFFGCGEAGNAASEDDDAEGCSYRVQGSGSTDIDYHSIGPLAEDGYEDCIPELRDPSLYDDVAAILDTYLGEYQDQDEQPIQFQCRPEGTWEFPTRSGDSFCVFYFKIPIWAETPAELYEGQIWQDDCYPSSCASFLDDEASLYLETDDLHYQAFKNIEEFGPVIWNFSSPEEGWIWTKLE